MIEREAMYEDEIEIIYQISAPLTRQMHCTNRLTFGDYSNKKHFNAF